MSEVWILWTAPACNGRGVAGAVPVEVCPNERQAKLGAPHHGFRLACYRHTPRPDGSLATSVWCWDTDDAGVPAGHGSWRAKLGPQQVRFLWGCWQYGGWHRICGWNLHRNLRHDERLANRLVERGLLRSEPRIVDGEPVTLYTVANPATVEAIVRAGGYVPEDALEKGEVRL